MTKHKVFISYHHANDQAYKDYLIQLNHRYQIFTDISVDTGSISDDLNDQRIREIIRDDFLQDSTVTIVLVGKETMYRKHVDWEIYSSMIDGKLNKKSGILAINLPSTNSNAFQAPHGQPEKDFVYGDYQGGWQTYNRAELCSLHPFVPKRIIDSIVNNDAPISVVPWERIEAQPANLKYLIEIAFRDRTGCNYDLSERMRRANS